jgi:hypothetical protein|tara:strand:- start:109 stop:447 length:339 start_codon:yes stop_codon:yes gene_type:complete
MSYLKAKKVDYPSIHKIVSLQELRGVDWFDLIRCLISDEPIVTKTPLSRSIRELSLDIQKNGLTHPILILNDEVVYGMQRSVIAKHLHFTHISCYHCQDKKQLEKIHKEQND